MIHMLAIHWLNHPERALSSQATGSEEASLLPTLRGVKSAGLHDKGCGAYLDALPLQPD